MSALLEAVAAAEKQFIYMCSAGN